VNDKEVAYDGVIVFAKRKLLKGQSLDISFTADAFAPGLSDEKDYTLRIYYYVKDSVGQVLNKESVLCENKFCKKNTKVECMQTFTAVQDGKYTVYLQSLPDNDMYKRSIKYKKKGNLMLYTYKAE
jgi:hypothetical protein